MPILEAEVNIYPDKLLHEVLEDDEHHRWWALMTKPRQEKGVARYLLAREIPFYLPLVWKDNFIRSRRVRSHLPLFDNYIFLYGTPDDRVTALQSNRLCHTLHAAEQSKLLNDLRNVEQLIAAGASLTVESCLQPGCSVRVKAGALRGVEGVVTQRLPRSRLLVIVDFFQLGVSLEIDDFMLEAIGD